MADQFTDQEVSQLRGQTECFIHRHPREDLDFQDRLALMQAAPITTVSLSTYDLARSNELILADTTANNVALALQESFVGREFQVIKTAASNKVQLLPAAGGWVNGSTTGIEYTAQWGSLTVKCIGIDYVVVSATTTFAPI